MSARARSAIADGHKWLNVPYDCGFAFVSERARLESAFTLAASYLPADGQPNFGYAGPESSRRARSLAVWATLVAYGRGGYRAMVERHCALAARVAAQADAAPDLELLAPPQLNIACFRYAPAGFGGDLDALNEPHRRRRSTTTAESCSARPATAGSPPSVRRSPTGAPPRPMST